MGFMDVAAKVAGGFAGAAGDTDAQSHIAGWQGQRQQQRQNQLQLAIAPLSQSLAADKERLKAFTDPNTGEPVEEHQADYDKIHNRMVDTIGQMRSLLGQHPPGETPFAVKLLDKFHIANHLSDELQAKRSDQVNQYYAQNRAMADAEANSAIPFEATPEGKKYGAQEKIQLLRNQGTLAAAQARTNKPVYKLYQLPDGTTSWQDVNDPDSIPDGAKAAATGTETEFQKASLQLRQSALDLQKAKFQASQDPNNPQTKAALQRAQQEALRSQAYMIRAQAGAFGTYNGQALPGAQLDSSGNPVGSMFQGNVKPTSTEMGRADLATSAIEQMDAMKGILKNRSDLFGPIAGRTTNFTQWVGSQDPDAQKFQAAARVAADHLAGVFGGRSQAALQHIYDVIGKNLTNPEAAIAGIEQMEVAANTIKARGTRHVVGGAPGTDVPPMTRQLLQTINDGLPPAAKAQLKEGHVTTFANGQKWTLTNGQPKQVQ